MLSLPPLPEEDETAPRPEDAGAAEGGVVARAAGFGGAGFLPPLAGPLPGFFEAFTASR
jgi:hypothetical protein